MKTKHFYAAIVAICTLAMTCLMSCEKKQQDQEPEPQTQTDNKPVAAFMDFNITFDSLTLEIFTVSFDYYDENGAKKNQVIENPEWALHVQSASLPAKLGFHMNLSKKEGVDLSQYQKFKVAYMFTETEQFVNAAGEPILRNQKHYNEGMPSQGLAIEKIDTYLSTYAEHPFESLLIFNADGTSESVKWE